MQNTESKQILSREETDKLLNVIDYSNVQLAIALMAYAGLRINEVMNLKMKDIDMESNQILIRARVKENYRFVPMASVLKPYLETYFTNIDEDLIILPKSLSVDYINYVLHQATKELEWDKKITCTMLRKSFAVNLQGSKVDVSTISNILGHHSIDTTAKYLENINKGNN